MPAYGEKGRGNMGPKSQKTSLPGRSAGEEPRRERSEKLWDWSELQGKAGRNAHKQTVAGI